MMKSVKCAHGVSRELSATGLYETRQEPGEVPENRDFGIHSAALIQIFVECLLHAKNWDCRGEERKVTLYDTIVL